MENTIILYSTLVEVLRQHKNWLDVRHMKTLAWMMNGLIQSGCISLSEWAVYVYSRAKLSASTERRFSRWLHNKRIEVDPLYRPLIEQALLELKGKCVYLALDTSMLWNTYCLIRISLIYRGRAIPIAWTVLKHGSAMVAFEVYKDLLDKTAAILTLFNCTVVFLADRGFGDTELTRYLKKELKWHFRIRIKSNFWIYRQGRPRCKTNRVFLGYGEALFWHNVQITEDKYGPFHIAIGRPIGSQDNWVVISDEPTDLKTFEEYGLRFDIEENFLDDKSNGFQLESSLIDSAEALNRLCFVLAITTLFLVSQGTVVVKEGKRRFVDSHWFRGISYLKIGWRWVKRALALVKGYTLITKLYLSGEPDPQMSMASKKQHEKRTQPHFDFVCVTEVAA